MQKEYYGNYALPYEERFQEEENYEIDWDQINREDFPFSTNYSDGEVALYRGYEYDLNDFTTLLFTPNSKTGTDAHITIFGRKKITLTNINGKELTSLLKNVTTTPRRLSKDEIEQRRKFVQLKVIPSIRNLK